MIKELIEKLGKPARHQGSVKEYTRIHNEITKHPAPNVLIFGTGQDMELWLASNPAGKTVFIEHHWEWQKFAKDKYPEAEVHQYSYKTRACDWKRFIKPCQELHDILFMSDLPKEILETEWDVIFVDAPHGWNDRKKENPGRMQSLWTASQLKFKAIFLHDCNRRIEDGIFKSYLGAPVEIIDTLYFTDKMPTKFN